ncbi:MAG: Mov34/MPN/PAD-1 family protein [Candidatus Thiodiazotropha endolucinida]
MITIILPVEWRTRLISELEYAGDKEIGGILMGEQISPGKFRIVEMTIQHSGGLVAKFIRSAQRALFALQRFFKRTGHQYRQFNYLGEWHSHPSFSPKPSERDHATMIDLTCNGETGANFLVLMITRLNTTRGLEGTVTVYLPNGVVAEGILINDG